MMRKQYIICIPLLLLLLQTSEIVAQKHLNEGDRYFDRNLFEEAIPHYLKELDKGKSYNAKNEARVKLARCYRLTGRFLEANEIYKKIVYASNRNNKSENVLGYANSLKSSALYEEAAEQFKQYIQLEPDDPMGPIYLESCYMAQEWLNELDEFFVMNHEMLNTVESDFAPAYYDDGIVITSSREGSLRRFINFSDMSNEAATDLYYINLLAPPDVQPEITNMEALNTFLHDGSATFSRDGNEVYFTRTVMGGKDRKTNVILNSLQVYHSRKDPAGNWSEPVSAFSFNSSDHSIGQPSLSADGTTIFFISDMPGGFGETDIYYSEKQDDGSWGPPVNAGRNINTFGHEIEPFIHGTDTLYFSSDTHPGMGKLDIFRSVKKDGSWGKVENMKTPLNSIGDDFGIVMMPCGNKGFFSSDRFNGHGKEDIYTLYKEEPLEFKFAENELRFPDHTIYNGLSFKISKEGEAESHMLDYSDGFFRYPLEEDSVYRLSIRKSGFSYDAVTMKISWSNEGELFTAELQSRRSPMVVKGALAYPKIRMEKRLEQGDQKKEPPVEVTDTIIEYLPVPSAEVFLAEEQTKINKSVTNEHGAYGFPDVLQSGVKYVVSATEMELPEDIEEEDVEEEALAEDSAEEEDVAEEDPLAEETAEEDVPAEEDAPVEEDVVEEEALAEEEAAEEDAPGEEDELAEEDARGEETADEVAMEKETLAQDVAEEEYADDGSNAAEETLAEDVAEEEYAYDGSNAAEETLAEDVAEEEYAYDGSNAAEETLAENGAGEESTTSDQPTAEKQLEDMTYIPEEYLAASTEQTESSSENTTSGGTSTSTGSDVTGQTNQSGSKTPVNEEYMNLSGTVISEQDKKAIPDVKIKVYSDDKLESEGATDRRGKFDMSVPVREKYDVDMNKKGYFHKQVQLTQEEARRPDALKKVPLPPIEKNKTMELRNIFFDLDKSTLKAESYRELNRLTDFMKENPEVIIKLNAHTDTRGNYYYNIELSQQRAISAKRYLQQQGIDGARIIAQGFGESFPVVPNATSEHDHSRNRRAEFSVTDRHGNAQWYFSADEPVHTRGFIISDENIYSNRRPYSENVPLPRGLFYRIKIAEFSKPVGHKAFKGLFPIVQQINSKNNTYGYYAGLFTSHDDAEEALQIIGRNFLDAEIEACYNNTMIPIREAIALNGQIEGGMATASLSAGSIGGMPSGGTKKTPEGVSIAGEGLIYAVQVGAFRRAPKPSAIENLRSVSSQHELITFKDKSNTVYAIGSFNSYAAAFNAKRSFRNSGEVSDAFIIAILNGEKIPVSEANRLTNR